MLSGGPSPSSADSRPWRSSAPSFCCGPLTLGMIAERAESSESEARPAGRVQIVGESALLERRDHRIGRVEVQIRSAGAGEAVQESQGDLHPLPIELHDGVARPLSLATWEALITVSPSVVRRGL
jgi:hypothetical protein